MIGQRFLAIGLAIAFAPAASVHAQVLYTVTNLGLPMGSTINFSFSSAADINNAGQVTGTAVSIFPSGTDRALRFSPGVGMIELGSLTPTGDSRGEAINSIGQVVGNSTFPGGRRAFRYSDGVGMVNLGVLPGHDFSEALGINDFGQVVGRSGISPSVNRVFRYSDGVGMVDLGMPEGSSSGTGVAINNSGQIAVRAGVQGSTRAYRHSDATGYVDIGTLGGMSAQPSDIGTNGEIVGTSETASGQSHAFYYSDSTGMLNLGILPGGATAGATAINALTQIVGNSIDPGNVIRPVLFQIGGSPIDLNDLIDPNSGWTLTAAFGINDAGQITGFGTIGGVQRAYLLTPVPEPSSFALAVIGSGFLSALRNRRQIPRIRFGFFRRPFK